MQNIETRFEAAQPALVGALLDLFVQVLAALPGVEIAPKQRPRMADFAALGEAVFRVQGQAAGAFLSRYGAMRKDGVLRTIDASPVGAAISAFLTEVTGGFNGTLSELLDRLERYRPHGEAWPRSAKGLGDALRRLAPALRLIGFECKSLPKTGGVIRWHIFPKAQAAEPSPASPARPASPASPASPARPEQAPAAPPAPPGHAGRSGHAPGSLAQEKAVPPARVDAQADDGEVF